MPPADSGIRRTRSSSIRPVSSGSLRRSRRWMRGLPLNCGWPSRLPSRFYVITVSTPKLWLTPPSRRRGPFSLRRQARRRRRPRRVLRLPRGRRHDRPGPSSGQPSGTGRTLRAHASGIRSHTMAERSARRRVELAEPLNVPLGKGDEMTAAAEQGAAARQAVEAGQAAASEHGRRPRPTAGQWFHGRCRARLDPRRSCCPVV
jgi:hypothetical protein